MATLNLKNINKIYPNGVQAVFDFNLKIKAHNIWKNSWAKIDISKITNGIILPVNNDKINNI